MRALLDVGAQAAQRRVDAGVATVDMPGSRDERLAVRDQPGEHEGRPRPDVTRLDRSTGQPRHAPHQGVVPVDANVRAEPGDLLHEHEARLEQVLRDQCGASATASRAIMHGCRSVGKPGYGSVTTSTARAAGGPRTRKPSGRWLRRRRRR